MKFIGLFLCRYTLVKREEYTLKYKIINILIHSRKNARILAIALIYPKCFFKFILRKCLYNLDNIKKRKHINERMNLMKTKSIISVIVVALISSIASSVLTFNMMKDKSSDLKAQQNNVKIVNSGETKNQNVYQAVAEKASPSVVGIISETIQESNFFNVKQTVQGSGTGFVVDNRGYILTNAHVVGDGAAKNVKVIYEEGKSTMGDVIWYDTTLDLAVVKVDKKDLVPAELGNSDEVKVGDIAIAIGNPLGTDLMTTVTQGIVSGLNRDVSTENTNMSGLIQTDASINPGNSGGPLLNQEGQVIGINTVKANADNLGFSIPINTAKTIVQKVIEDKNYKKPVLGITGLDVKSYVSYTGQNLGVDNGVVVKSVQSGSVAEKAGIKPGDIVVNIDGKDIKNMGDVSKKMYEYTKDKNFNIQVIRESKKVNLKTS